MIENDNSNLGAAAYLRTSNLSNNDEQQQNKKVCSFMFVFICLFMFYACFINSCLFLF